MTRFKRFNAFIFPRGHRRIWKPSNLNFLLVGLYKFEIIVMRCKFERRVSADIATNSPAVVNKQGAPKLIISPPT